MREVILLLILCSFSVYAQRPKVKTLDGMLVAIEDIPVGSCGGDSYYGLGMMDGGLEECERWKITEEKEMEEYENDKCKRLRLHAHVEDGKCVCDGSWKGPICAEFDGCPAGMGFHRGVCTKNICQHDGKLAVGPKKIECICEAPWDGPTCERLACWRKTNYGEDKRFKNAGDHCECSRYYEGENCDVILECNDGTKPVDGKCVCKPGYFGEICDRRCPAGQLTCGSATMSLMLCCLITALWAFRSN